jgi:hypothetical protein
MPLCCHFILTKFGDINYFILGICGENRKKVGNLYWSHTLLFLKLFVDNAHSIGKSTGKQ